jgi:hypothetical protein
MRRFARVLLITIGTLVALAGLAVALLAGPDDTVSTGERELTSETAGIVTSPDLLGFIGPSLHVAATATGGGEVFVGVGHEVDVAAYFDGIAYDQIARLRPPASYDVVRVDGTVSGVQPEPASRDWWYVQSAGADRQAVVYPLGAERVNAVVMAVDGEPSLAVTLELGLQVDNLFVTALLVLAGGLVVLVVALLLLRPRRREPRTAAQLPEPVWHGERNQ